MSDAEAPAPQSDLSTRFAAGVVMAAVAIVAAYFGGWFFRALVLAAGVAMLIEWADMHRVKRLWAWIGAVLLAGTLLGVSEYLDSDRKLCRADRGRGVDVRSQLDGFGAILVWPHARRLQPARHGRAFSISLNRALPC